MKTNKQLIKKLLGTTLDEAFLIEAMTRYCQTVLEDKTDWGNKALINQDLWKVIAKQNLATIQGHFK